MLYAEFQVVETTDMLVELKVPAGEVIQLYLDTSHLLLQADIDAGNSSSFFLQVIGFRLEHETR